MGLYQESGRSFQFTTSRGGRRLFQEVRRHILSLSIHDLTRRSTVINRLLKIYSRLSIHDLTRRSTQSPDQDHTGR